MHKKQYKKIFLVIIVLCLSFIFKSANGSNDVQAYTATSEVNIGNDSDLESQMNEDIIYEEHVNLSTDNENSNENGIEEDHLHNESSSYENTDGIELNQEEKEKVDSNENSISTNDLNIENDINSEEVGHISNADLSNTEDPTPFATHYVTSLANLKTFIEGRTSANKGDVIVLTNSNNTIAEGINVPNGYSFTLLGGNQNTLIANTYINGWQALFIYNYPTPIEINLKSFRFRDNRDAGLVSSTYEGSNNNIKVNFDSVDFETVNRIVNAPRAEVTISNIPRFIVASRDSNSNDNSVFKADIVNLDSTLDISVNGNDRDRLIFNVNYLGVNNDFTVNSDGAILKGLDVNKAEMLVGENVQFRVNTQRDAQTAPTSARSDFILGNLDLIENRGSIRIISANNLNSVIKAKRVVDNNFTIVPQYGSSINIEIVKNNNTEIESVIESQDISMAAIFIKVDLGIQTNHVIQLSGDFYTQHYLEIDVGDGATGVLQNNSISGNTWLKGNIKISSGERDSSIIEAADLIVLEESDFFLNTKSHGDKPLILLSGNLSIANNANFSLNVLGPSNKSANALIDFTHNSLNEHKILIEKARVNIVNQSYNYNSIIGDGDLEFSVNLEMNFSPKQDHYLIVKDVSDNPKLMSNAYLTVKNTRQINLWTDSNSNPTIFEDDKRFGASGRYAFLDQNFNDLINLNKVRINDGKLTDSGISDDLQTDFDNFNDLDFSNKGVVAIGDINLNLNDNSSNPKILTGTTGPNAIGQILTRRPYQFSSNSNGEINTTFEKDIINGTHTVGVFSNFLYTESTVTYRNEGSFTISEFPEQFNFGTITIDGNKNTFSSLDEEEIVIYDGRLDLKGWKLSLYIEEDLNTSVGAVKIIEDAFKFKISDSEVKRITKSPVLLYETESNNYEPETVISFKEGSGLMLYIENLYDLTPDSPYQSKLVWVLEAKE